VTAIALSVLADRRRKRRPIVTCDLLTLPTAQLLTRITLIRL
jgi:hypothetical protein